MDALVAQSYVNAWAIGFDGSWAEVCEASKLSVFYDVPGLHYIAVMESSPSHVVVKASAPNRGGLFFFKWEVGELREVNLVHEIINGKVEATYPIAGAGSTNRFLVSS